MLLTFGPSDRPRRPSGGLPQLWGKGRNRRRGYTAGCAAGCTSGQTGAE